MPEVVHVVRHEGPTSEVFVGPFDDHYQTHRWIERNRTDAWRHVTVAPLEQPDPHPLAAVVRGELPDEQAAVLLDQHDADIAEAARREMSGTVGALVNVVQKLTAEFTGFASRAIPHLPEGERDDAARHVRDLATEVAFALKDAADA